MNMLLDPSAHPVIGHRGNRAHAPENTLESLQQAMALGVDAVEFDLRVSRDGVLVVMHDPTLERTTNATGPVSARTVSELGNVDAGANFTTDNGRTFPYRARGIGVPTFDAVVETVRDIPMIIELKTTSTTERIRAAIKRHNIAHRVVVAGFDWRAIHPLRGAGFALGSTSRDSIGLLPRAFLRRAATAAVSDGQHSANVEWVAGAVTIVDAFTPPAGHSIACVDHQHRGRGGATVGRGCVRNYFGRSGDHYPGAGCAVLKGGRRGARSVGDGKVGWVGRAGRGTDPNSHPFCVLIQKPGSSDSHLAD